MRRIPLDLAPARANALGVAQNAYEREERRYWARHERLRRQWLARREERRVWRYDGLSDFEDSGDSGDIHEEDEYE